MSNGNVTNTNPVNMLALSFRSTITSYVDRQSEFEVKGRRVVYEMIAKAFMVAQNILRENKEDRNKAFEEHGIVVSKNKNANPYSPIVKLLFGEWKLDNGEQKFSTAQPADQVTIFEPNRSAEKYACVFRYFNKHKNEFPRVEDIIDHIEDKTLKVIEDMDRTMSGTSKSFDEATAADLGSDISLDDVDEIAKPTNLPSDMTAGSGWFKVVNGKVYIFGYTKMDDDAFRKRAISRGRKLIDENKTAVESKTAADLVRRMKTKAAA